MEMNQLRFISFFYETVMRGLSNIYYHPEASAYKAFALILSKGGDLNGLFHCGISHKLWRHNCS